MSSEKRKNPRFLVRDNAFTIFKSDPAKLIPIVDISLGGLSIAVNGTYMNVAELSRMPRLEILTDDCRFYIDQLPYQLLTPYRNCSQNTFGSFQHIYGVRFIDLMASQRNRLKVFIRNHTRGGMTPKFIHKFSHQMHQYFGKKNFRDVCRNSRLQRPSL